MATIIGNGTITFGDGTVRNSGNFIWGTGVTGVPTLLSQYTNDLGNYGSFLTSANATLGNTLSDPNNIINNCGNTRGSAGQRNQTNYAMTWNGSKVGWIINNCNCNCNC